MIGRLSRWKVGTYLNEALNHSDEGDNTVGAATGRWYEEITECTPSYCNAKETIGREDSCNCSSGDLRYHIAIKERRLHEASLSRSPVKVRLLNEYIVIILMCALLIQSYL